MEANPIRMKATALVIPLFSLLLWGCSSAGPSDSTDLKATMTKLYAQTVEYENGDLPLNHMNLVWAQRDMTLDMSRRFWNLYGEFLEKEGSNAAEGWLFKLVESHGVCSVLISFHIRKAISDEFATDLIQRIQEKTRYFSFVAGDPVQWDKVARYRRAGMYN